MDLAERAAVTPTVVWGRLSGSLDEASKGYGAELVLVGRVRDSAEGVSADWEFWYDGEPIAWSEASASLADAGSAGADVVANEIALKQSVHAGESRAHAVTVSGVRDATSYRALMDFVGALEFVDGVQIDGLSQRGITLAIEAPLELPRLVELLTADERLNRDPLARGFETILAWRDDP